MSIQIVGGNLNQVGDQGRFETDPSTWGFGGGGAIIGSVTRSNAFATQGVFSLRHTVTVSSSLNPLYAFGQATVQAGKKYIVKAKVYVPSGFNPVSAGKKIGFFIDQFFIITPNFPIISIISKIEKTVGSANDNWQDIEILFEVTDTTYSDQLSVFVNSEADTGFAVNVGGVLHVDEFFIFEYIDVENPCTLSINSSGTVVVNESVPAANNGSITVAVTGGTAPFEYSKNGGITWQLSNSFTGLAPGIYTIVVREQARVGCNSTQTFAINSAGVTHSFTTSVTNETVLGANDGAIAVTVSGTGGPFTFSKDSGVTYQSGNVFTGLAPDTYTIVVRNAALNILAANVTVLPGAVLFEKIWHSRNPVLFAKQAPLNWQVNNNFRLYDDVRVEEVSGSGIFVSALKISLTPIGNEVTFQVSEAFRDSLSAAIDLSGDFVRLTDRVKMFKHYTGQLIGTEEVPLSLVASNTHLVVMGGISKYKLATLDFFGSLSTTKKFLTWAPLIKQVDPIQLDFLTYFIFSTTTNTLQLRLKAYYDDNTNQTSVTKTKTGVSYGQLYQLPAGPINSGASAINSAKKLIKYEITLLDQSGNVISETRTYVLDAISHPRRRFFVFLNSLAGFEVLRFTGVASSTLETSKEQIVKYLPLGYAGAEGEIQVNESSMQLSHSYGSGNDLTSDWLEYMSDLLSSKRVYLLEGNRVKPIIVDADSYDMGEDQNYERFIRFKAVEAFEEENYTPANA